MAATVLVVDDERPVLDALSLLLADEGYQVLTAPDGSAAWQLIEAGQLDLVLADLMMPGLDGWGLLRAMREHAHARTIPVVLMSAAYTQRPLGIPDAVPFVPKPIDLDALLQLVENLLTRE